MPDNFSGQPIPDGFGPVRGVKAVPITGTVLGSPVDFKFCEIATTLTTVYVKQNDTWITVIPTETDLPNGEFTLAIVDCVDGDSVLECKVDATLRNYTNPGDIIAQMNAVFAGVPYDDSGYNTVTWPLEKVKLANIGVCFNEKKDMLDWIEKIQGGSDKGFIYTTQGDGKRILIVDDITESSSLTIRKEDIRGDINADRDFQDFASTVEIKYNKDYESGRFISEKNTAWNEYVKAKYRQEKDKTFETFLTSSVTAAAKAADFANRLKDVKLIFEFSVSGIDYFGMTLFQIVTAEMDKETRPIFGTRTCQVLGIKYNFKDETVSLTLKEI